MQSPVLRESDVTILRGVTIGEHSVIGARSATR